MQKKRRNIHRGVFKTYVPYECRVGGVFFSCSPDLEKWKRTFGEVLVNMDFQTNLRRSNREKVFTGTAQAEVDTLQVMLMMLVVMMVLIVGLRQSGQVDTPQVSNI